MNERISVGLVGAGARTALGRSLASSAAAVRARIARVGRHPFMTDRLGRAMSIAHAAWLPEWIAGEDRFVTLARNAAKEALAPMFKRHESALRMRVFIGLPEARPGRPPELDEAIARAFGESATWGKRVDEVTVIPTGNAASLMAIQRACESIERGESDVCLAGGVDSYFEGETMEWLDETGRLHMPHRHYGFIPGEAAGFCVLASARWLEKHKERAPITVLAAVSSIEEAPMRTPTVCIGAGLREAFAGALLPLSPKGARVDCLIGDLNGDLYRSDELGFTLTVSADRMPLNVQVLAPAQYWGDVGAASGALFAGLAFTAATRGYGPGPHSLLWASSEGGSRAAALLRRNTISDTTEET